MEAYVFRIYDFKCIQVPVGREVAKFPAYAGSTRKRAVFAVNALVSPCLSGAGKTYTMLGTDCEPGIMVLTLNDLFTKIEETREDTIYRVTMAYLEVEYSLYSTTVPAHLSLMLSCVEA